MGEFTTPHHYGASKAADPAAASSPQTTGRSGPASSSPLPSELESIRTISSGEITRLIQRVKAGAGRANIRVIDLPAEFDPERLVQKYQECSEWQWSNEYRFPRDIRRRVRNSVDADWCLVPFMAKCWFNKVAKYRVEEMAKAASKVLLGTVRHIQSSQVVRFIRDDPELHEACPPRKQVWIFASGVGPTMLGPNWSGIISGDETVLLLAEGDQLGGFYNGSKDIIIPATPKIRTPYNGERRNLLALFRGSSDLQLRDADGREVRRQNVLRQALLENLSGAATDVVVGAFSPSYDAEMKDSIFCFIPRGNTPWTRRIFDAIVSGCIPVVLSNAIVFPFESLLDWSLFTIKLPESYVITKPKEIIDLLRRIARDPRLLSPLQDNLRAVSPMLTGQNGEEGALTPLEGVLYALTETGRALSSEEERSMNTATTFWSPLTGTWVERGNAGRQVGPSFHAGAVPHPQASMLWSDDAS